MSSVKAIFIVLLNYIVTHVFCLVLQQFTQLLEQQATIDQYAEWANNLVDTCLKVGLIKKKLLDWISLFMNRPFIDIAGNASYLIQTSVHA